MSKRERWKKIKRKVEACSATKLLELNAEAAPGPELSEITWKISETGWEKVPIDYICRCDICELDIISDKIFWKRIFADASICPHPYKAFLAERQALSHGPNRFTAEYLLCSLTYRMKMFFYPKVT